MRLRMASQLQASSVSLEQKVEERTRELGCSVQELQALGEIGQTVNSTLALQCTPGAVQREPGGCAPGPASGHWAGQREAAAGGSSGWRSGRPRHLAGAWAGHRRSPETV